MKHCAFLLGAGFSAWAAGLPVVAQLFDFAIKTFGQREERKLSIIKEAWKSWISNNPESHNEQFIATALAGETRVRTAVLWYITRRLSEPYIWSEWHSGRWRRHVLMIDEYRKNSCPGIRRAQGVFNPLYLQLAGIVTTNYDLIVEYALGTKHFHYGEPGEKLYGRGPYPVSQWKSPVRLCGSLPLAKMHGSISWDECFRYTDGRRGLTGNALIVAPKPEKLPPAKLAGVWELAGTILQATRHLVVFGFGFNLYDNALLSHFREHGRSIERVTIIDLSPKPERARSIWPNAEIKIACPPTSNDDISGWAKALTIA